MQQFFSEWSTYEKVVVNDYMHHREYFSLLTEHLAAIGRPMTVVDLGCGDAKPVGVLLQQLDVRLYVGIDQSPVALNLAKDVLESNGTPYEFMNTSMQAGIRAIDEPVDLIIASYSLHHLSPTEKLQMLAECRRITASDGVVAIVDVFREPEESRSAYLIRWEDHAKRTFTALATEELRDLVIHVRENDFPETFTDYEKIGHAAGFENVRLLKESEERLNKLVLLS